MKSRTSDPTRNANGIAYLDYSLDLLRHKIITPRGLHLLAAADRFINPKNGCGQDHAIYTPSQLRWELGLADTANGQERLHIQALVDAGVLKAEREGRYWKLSTEKRERKSPIQATRPLAALFRHRLITPMECAVMARIMATTNKGGDCFIGSHGLADYFGISRSTARNVLSSLRTKGLLEPFSGDQYERRRHLVPGDLRGLLLPDSEPAPKQQSQTKQRPKQKQSQPKLTGQIAAAQALELTEGMEVTHFKFGICDLMRIRDGGLDLEDTNGDMHYRIPVDSINMVD